MCLTPCWSLKTFVYLILASTRFICASNPCQVSCLSPWRKVWYLHPPWRCWWQGLRGLRRYRACCGLCHLASSTGGLMACKGRFSHPQSVWPGESHFTFLSLNFPICQWGQPGALPSWPDSDSSWNKGQESTFVCDQCDGDWPKSILLMITAETFSPKTVQKPYKWVVKDV